MHISFLGSDGMQGEEAKKGECSPKTITHLFIGIRVLLAQAQAMDLMLELNPMSGIRVR